MDYMKKGFQKAVKAFRDTLPEVTWYLGGGRTEQHRPEYPKAMMTASQVRKGTATINCSYGHKAKENAENLMQFPQFKAWCDEWDVRKVFLEEVDNPYGEVKQIQIRIYYPTADEIKAMNEELAREELEKFEKEVY